MSVVTRCATSKAVLFFLTVVFAQGCATFHQPGKESTKIFSRVYLTEYNTAWQAALEALKSFDLTVQNRQGGVLQTAWIDNTTQKNFIESFGDRVTYMKAKYRLSLSLAPGHYNGRPSVKVSIQKEQMIQRDVLEGWQQVQSDAIEENTILYRIGRIVFLKLRIKQLEDQKVKEILNEGVH